MDFPRTVYLIRHNKTKRIYIGSSKRPEQRFKSHMEALRSGRHPVEDMQTDFDQYGEDYTVEFLEVITKFEDRHHEYDWMKKYNSHIRGIGYNYKDVSNNERKKNRNREKLLRYIGNISEEEALTFISLFELFGKKEKCEMDSQEQSPNTSYISEIVTLLRKTDDLSLLDLILQILQKAVQ